MRGFSSQPSEPENDWKESLARAARKLPAADARAQLFFEDREDLRIVVDGDHARETVRSRVRGLSARTGLRSVYQSDPEPEDAERLAGMDLGRSRDPRAQSPQGEPRASLDAASAQTLLLELIGRTLRNTPAGSATAVARWVEFRQLVLVTGADGAVRSDVRQGRRVRLELRLHGGRARTEAVGERVMSRTSDEALMDLPSEVIRRAEERRDTVPAEPGSTQVVFSSGVGGILLHEIVGHALEADAVLAGRSALAARGRGIARPEVTVVDDPRRGRASWRIDDEGQAARAICLVQAGDVQGTVSDLTCAAAGGWPVTGHGRRASFHQPVLPRLGCTFLANGRLDPREVIEGTDSGILVKRMEAAGTDPMSGHAFFRVSDADRIRGGRAEHTLTPLLLEVTLHEALSSLDLIGDDLAFDTCIGSCVRDGQPLATSVGAPTCRIGIARVCS